MTTSDQFCCVCFRNQLILKQLSYIEDDGVSLYVKLTECIPEMCVREVADCRYSCFDCCKDINIAYNFRKRCLKNLPFFLDYVKKTSNVQCGDNMVTTKCESISNDEELSDDCEEMDEYPSEAIDMVKVELQEDVDSVIDNENCDTDDGNEDKKGLEFYIPPHEMGEIRKSITPELEIMEKHNIQLAIDVAKKRSPKRTKAEGYSGPFKCDLCPKECPYWSQLVIHRRTHTGEKPFQCAICKKYFSKSHSLIRHTRTHTGEKPHECNICHRRFLSSSNLQSHLKTHFEEKPYECLICKKSFKTQSCLLGHKKRHSDERPHKCSMCTMSFKDAGSLTRHKRTHTLENYHKCDSCNKGFRDRSGLLRHMKNHEQLIVPIPISLMKNELVP